MKVVIIDDDAASIEALEKLLATYDDLTVAGTANNGIRGISLVKQEEPDLLFLDVELPDISGLDFLERTKAISKKPCRVVIYTAHSMYMLPAFRGKAFDFLLKPADEKELRKIIGRYMIEESAPQNTDKGKDSGKDREKLLFNVNATDFRLVDIEDVGLFQYNHDLRIWEVIVAGSDTPIRLKRSTNNENLLMMDSRFVQVSQRHIININYLMEVSDGICRLYPPFNHIDSVKVGRTFRKKLTERFNAL